MPTSNDEETRKELISRLTNGDFLVRAIHEAASQALSDHKRTGDPIAGWRDEQVAWILAPDIVVEEATR